MGIDTAIAKLAPELTGHLPPWDYKSLENSKEIFASQGLDLIGLEGDQFDMNRIKLGLSGRDEDIDKYCAMLHNMGRLNINLLCYNFMAGIGIYGCTYYYSCFKYEGDYSIARRYCRTFNCFIDNVCCD